MRYFDKFYINDGRMSIIPKLGKKETSVTVDNVPIKNLQIECANINGFYIKDPRGFSQLISNQNIKNIIDEVGIEKNGVLTGEYIWASNNGIILVSVGGKKWKELEIAVEKNKVSKKRVSDMDVVVGQTVTVGSSAEHVMYLGKHYLNKYVNGKIYNSKTPLYFYLENNYTNRSIRASLTQLATTIVDKEIDMNLVEKELIYNRSINTRATSRLIDNSNNYHLNYNTFISDNIVTDYEFVIKNIPLGKINDEMVALIENNCFYINVKKYYISANRNTTDDTCYTTFIKSFDNCGKEHKVSNRAYYNYSGKDVERLETVKLKLDLNNNVNDCLYVIYILDKNTNKKYYI